MTDIEHPLALSDCLHTTVSRQRLPRGNNKTVSSLARRPFGQIAVCSGRQRYLLDCETDQAPKNSPHDAFDRQNIQNSKNPPVRWIDPTALTSG
jgi:hypothetical protein